MTTQHIAHPSPLPPLIRLDLMRLKPFLRFVALFVLLGIAPSLLKPGEVPLSQGLGFVLAAASLLISRLFTADEKGTINMLLSTLPVSRQLVITAHYLAALLVISLTLALLLLLSVYGQEPAEQRLMLVGVPVTILLLSTALTAPLASRGYASRIVSLAPMLLVVPVVLVTSFAPPEQLSLWVSRLLAQPVNLLTVGLILALLLFIASYFLAVRFYEARDF